ncbi:hypothetical protein [Streptomyces sp. NPDC059850]|uniref:hypothetical protein n=1 Tax=Streptomyces sp. NPDC059850 TaxID=3346970 RepID=UPI00364DADD2
MGSYFWITPRGQEITAPDPGPVNPAGTEPGKHRRNGKRPADSPAGAPAPRRLRKPKAS